MFRNLSNGPLAPCGEGEAPWAPTLDGVFRRVFVPPGTRYLNDHTVVRGADGTYHVYGITNEAPAAPQAERTLLHATAPSLEGPWTPQTDILSVVAPKTVLWAPYAFERAAGQWTMFFWGGSPDGAVHRADSTDLNQWNRVDLPAPGGRDPFIMRVGSQWFLYSVGVGPATNGQANGQILLTTSSDLAQWTQIRSVLEDPEPSFTWGNLESPSISR